MSHPSHKSPDSAVPPAGRTEIMAAATRLFAESGYDRTSINAIAQGVGTSKANVFHHFGAKEALYFEVMREACAPFRRASAVVASSDPHPEARLRNLLRHDWELFRRFPEYTKLVAREVLEGGRERARSLAHGVLRERFSELVTLFRDARELDTAAPDVPAELLAIMAIACNAVTFQAHGLLRQLPGMEFIADADQYAILVTRALLDTTGGDGGPACGKRTAPTD